ncbi:uncharacterized protein LOC134184525 [Corticium candelabrum]|uniref:uncharacterized protein LOC134184525 n=1 Tax=Corticium candelabrum TaxID=121492 RepID=UPI002E273651|nr:uncharacterized protein LOC134184525 [Corticium candelabrum]
MTQIACLLKKKIECLAKKITSQAEKKCISRVHLPQILSLLKQADLLCGLPTKEMDANGTTQFRKTKLIAAQKKLERQNINFKRISKRVKAKSKGTLQAPDQSEAKRIKCAYKLCILTKLWVFDHTSVKASCTTVSDSSCAQCSHWNCTGVCVKPKDSRKDSLDGIKRISYVHMMEGVLNKSCPGTVVEIPEAIIRANIAPKIVSPSVALEEFLAKQKRRLDNV